MKLRLPNALLVALMAAAVAPAMADDTTTTTTSVVVGGTTYADTVVLTAQTTTEPTSGSYVLFNMGTNKDYEIEGSSNWVYSTTKTLIGAPGTSTDGTTTYTGSRLFFDTSNVSDVIVKANIIVGDNNSMDSIRFWNNGTYKNVLKGDITMVNSTTRIWNEAGTNYIEGALNGEGKTLRIVGQATTPVLRLSGGATLGTLNMAAAAGSVTLSKTDADGTTAANSLTYNIGSLYCDSTTPTLTVEDTVTLNLTAYDKGKVVNNGTMNVTNMQMSAGSFTNAGTVTITNYTNGTITNTGTLKLAASSSLGKTLAVGGGTLDLSSLGTLTVNADNFGNFTLNTDQTENGYLNGSMALATYSGSNDVALGTGKVTGAGYLTNSTDISYDTEKKQLLANFDGTKGFYIVVKDGSTADDATGYAADATTAIWVNNGKTLTLASGWNDAKAIKSQGSTISIVSGASLSVDKLAALAATTITGAGTYTTTGAKLLGSNVSLAEDWTGTVKLTAGNGSNTGVNTSTLFKTGSTIEFNGVNAWDSDNWNGTMSYNVKLTDNDSTAAWTDGAFTKDSDNATGTFSGKWSGDGKFVANLSTSNRYQNYTYTGDISNWTGTFDKGGVANTTTVLTFQDNATALNAAVTTTTGTLNVVFSGTTAKTASKAISASAITVNDAKVSFSGNVTTTGAFTANADVVIGNTSSTDATAISLNSVTVAANKTLSLVGKTSGSMTVTSGTVNIDGAATLSSLSLAVGQAVNINSGDGISLTHDGLTYTAQSGQTASISKGGTTTGSVALFGSECTVTNAAISTTDSNKAFGAVLDNVSITSSGNIWLQGADNSKKLKDVNMASGSFYVGAGSYGNGDAIQASVSGSANVGTLTIGTKATLSMGDGTDNKLGISSYNGKNAATVTGGVTMSQSDSTVTFDGNSGSGSTATVNNALIELKDSTNLKLTDVTIATNSGVAFNDKNVVILQAVAEGQANNVNINNVTFKGGEVTMGTAKADASGYNHDGTLVATNVTVSADSTLNANLSVSGAMTFGGTLEMGCSVNFTGATTISLSDSMASTVTSAGKVAVLTSVDSYSGLENATYNGQALQAVQDAGASTYTLYATPEPATTTLSLLALAGLCARRRRH